MWVLFIYRRLRLLPPIAVRAFVVPYPAAAVSAPVVIAVPAVEANPAEIAAPIAAILKMNPPRCLPRPRVAHLCIFRFLPEPLQHPLPIFRLGI
jgi:hypothetical protein